MTIKGRSYIFAIIYSVIIITYSYASEVNGGIGQGTSGFVIGNQSNSKISPQANSTIGWKTVTCSTIETYYDNPYFRVVIKNTDNTYVSYSTTSSFPNNWQALMIAACSRANKVYQIYYYNTSWNWSAIKF